MDNTYQLIMPVLATQAAALQSIGDTVNNMYSN
jgi:hypothetical protein